MSTGTLQTAWNPFNFAISINLINARLIVLLSGNPPLLSRLCLASYDKSYQLSKGLVLTKNNIPSGEKMMGHPYWIISKTESHLFKNITLWKYESMLIRLCNCRRGMHFWNSDGDNSDVECLSDVLTFTSIDIDYWRRRNQACAISWLSIVSCQPYPLPVESD